MAIKSVQLPDGSKVEIDEWLHWPLYSTVESSSTASLNLRAFTYVVGQVVPRSAGITARNATPSDTNQVVRARLNQDEAFIAFSWTYEVFGLSDGQGGASPPADAAPEPLILSTNLKRLQRDVMLELFIGAGISKPMASCPLSWIQQGIGAPAWGTGDAPATGVNISYGTGGSIAPKKQRLWNLPVYIGSDRNMYVQAWSPIGAISGLSQNFRLRVWLDGLKRRPVA